MSNAYDHTHWRTQRHAAVTSPKGNLALVETRWTGEPADLDAERASAAPTADVTDDQRADLVDRRAGARPSGLGCRIPRHPHPSIGSTASNTTRRGSYAAAFTPVAEDRTIPFEHIRDNGGTRDLVVPGDILFTLRRPRLHAERVRRRGQRCCSSSATRPTASETYGSGRFLFVQREPGAAVGEAGTSSSTSTAPSCRPAASPRSTTVRCRRRRTASRCRSAPGRSIVVFRDGFDIYAALTPASTAHIWSIPPHEEIPHSRRSAAVAAALAARGLRHRAAAPPTALTTEHATIDIGSLYEPQNLDNTAGRRPGRHRGVQRQRLRGPVQAHRRRQGRAAARQRRTRSATTASPTRSPCATA